MTALLSILLFFSTQAQSQSFEVLSPEVEQGGVLVIRIAPQWRPPAVFNPAISIYRQDKQGRKYYIGNQHRPNIYGEVFIGIDASTKPGKYIVILEKYGSRGMRSSWDYEEIEVIEKNFPEVQIPRKMGTIDINRWRRDQSKIKKALQGNDAYASYVNGPFVQPLDTIMVTDKFYLQRKFLDGISIHRGTDIKIPIGTSVRAINSGKVVLADYNFLLEGNLVIIDHGSGIVSYYLHLSQIYVHAGQFVKNVEAEVVALSGDTGLGVRYPHLHFAVKVNGVSIDPLEFIKTMNESLNQ